MINVPPDDRIVLGRMLTELARRSEGAIEFWTLVCVERTVPQREEFVTHHGEVIRSLAVVLGELFVGTPWFAQAPVRDLFQTIGNACQKLQSAFVTLEQFDAVPLAKLRQATDDLTHGYSELREAILQVSQVTNVPFPYWSARAPERDEYFQRIMQGLFESFRQARGGEQVTQAASSPGG